MDDLLEFLHARYDERERSVEDDVLPSGEAAWVLADLDAKQEIVDYCERVWDDGTSAADLAQFTLRQFARQFAVHPDYRDEWKP